MRTVTSRHPRVLDGSQARDTLELALENYETMLAVIANNIANADTPAFKRSRAIVEDLGYHQEGRPGVQDSSGQHSPNGFSIGAGSQIVGTDEETEGSGCATTGAPGASGSGLGKIRQGWIERSNVDLRQELAEWKRIRQTCRAIRTR